jgi:hypothetical protein
MVMAQVNLTDYSNRVFEVIKAKFGLKDKSEAINKFTDIYGDDVLDREASDEYVRKIIDICNRHEKTHPNRKMTFKQLDALLGV